MDPALRADGDGRSAPGEPGAGSFPAPGMPPATPTDHALKLVARREHSLMSLMELSHELTVSLDLYGLTDLALFNLMGAVGTARAAFWMRPGEDPGTLVLVRSYGIRTQWARAIGSAFGPTMVESLAGSGEAVLAASVKDLLDPAPARLIEEAGVALFSPVMTRGRVLGLVALGNRVSGEPYSPMDLQLLQASAGLLGVALENTGLYNRLLESHRQLKKANEELRHLDQLKNEFLSNVNHELRTPLTIIIAYVDILLNQELDSGRQRGFLNTISDESLKLKGLLEKLLDFSALSKNRLETRPEPGNLAEHLEAFYRERLPGVTASLRELVLQTLDGSTEAVFDPAAVTKILDALLENAIKFTPQGTRVVLRLRASRDASGDWAVIEVQDDGPGIPADRLPFLFDSFRQGDGSSTRLVGGMGIGLCLAHRLAEVMGGRLEADTEPGRGSTLRLFLPRG